MPKLQNLILSDLQTLQKIRRIAYQIYENNFDETAIVFAGIEPNGNQLTKLLVAEFQQITQNTGIEIIVTSLQKSANLTQGNSQINSQNTLSYELACDKEVVENKVVIVIDDVLHTGRTLIYGLNPLLNIAVKKIQTVVLVKREHHQFPVHADYVGYALSTTILQHVHVELSKEGEVGVYLF
jgi:pyrimidine operon attenuation protein / uracil phosphoribosyltransferase